MEGVNHKNLQPPLGDDVCISMAICNNIYKCIIIRPESSCMICLILLLIRA